jgi:hypothetical protein
MSNNNVDPNFNHAKFREEVRKVIEGIEGMFAGKTWANVAEEEGLFDKINAAAESAVRSIPESAAGAGGGGGGGATIVAVPATAKTESVKINGVPVSQWLATKKPLRINGKTVKEWLAIKKDKRPIFNGPGAAPSPGIKENNSPSLLVTGFDTNKYDLDDFILIASLGGPVRDVFKPEGKNYLFVEMVGPEAAKRVKHLFAETELKIGGRKIMFDVSDRSSAARYKGRKPGGGGGGGAAAGAGKKRQGGGAITMKNSLNTAKHFLSNKLSAARNSLRVAAKTTNKIGREIGSYAIEKTTSMQKPITDPLATVKATAKEVNKKIQSTAKNLANKAKRSITRKNKN